MAVKQRHLLWGDGELPPALGMRPGGFAIEEWGAGTKGKQQCGFAAQQPAGRHDRFAALQTKVDVNAGGHHTGAVAVLDELVIRVVWIGPLKALAVAKAEAAAWQQGELTLLQPLAQTLAGLEQMLELGLIGGLRRRDVFEVAAIGLGDDPVDGRGSFAGAAHHRAVAAAGVHLHFKAFEQALAHGCLAASRQARALSMPRALLRVSSCSAAG